MVIAQASFIGYCWKIPIIFSSILSSARLYSYSIFSQLDFGTSWILPFIETFIVSGDSAATSAMVPFTHLFSGSFLIKIICAPFLSLKQYSAGYADSSNFLVIAASYLYSLSG